MEVGFASKVSKWTARSLTRFSVQSDWLSANCRVRLNAASVDAQEVHIAVGKHWFVDQVKLVDTPDSDIRAEFFERGNESEPVTDVVVSWQRKRSSISLELEVAAHRPLETNANRFRLFTQRLLAIPNADQIDNYVIEPSASYQVEVGAGLLLFQLQPLDLPFWQQQLLKDQARNWIFQGLRNSIPPIFLVAKRGSYNGQLTALVTSDPKSVGSSSRLPASIHYRLHIEPISNPVDSIVLAIPEGMPETPMIWSIESGLDSSSEPIVSQRNAEGELAYLRLPAARDSAFSISCKLETHKLGTQGNATEVNLPIIGLPEATSCDTTLMLRQTQARLRTSSNIELLPLNYLENDNLLLQALGADNIVDLSAFMVVRLDGKKPHSIAVSADTPRLMPGMVWSENVEHFIDSRTSRSHVLRWIVQLAGPTDFEVSLPAGWRVLHTAVNGKPLRVEQVTGQPLTIPIRERQWAKIELRCASSVGKTSWLKAEKFERPSVNLSTRLASCVVHVPPTCVAIQEVFRPRRGGKLMDRINPRQWWSWLMPNTLSEARNDAQPPGWSSVELVSSDSRDSEIWLVDRSALAGVAMGFSIAMTMVLFVVFRVIGRLTWGVYGIALVSLILLPSSLVGPIQLFLLSATMASLLRVFQIVFLIRRDSSQQRNRFPSRSSFLRATGLGIACILCSQLHAQQSSASAEPVHTDRIGETEHKLFGILVPVAADGSVSGEYAYIPSELDQLLSSSKGQTSATPGPRLLSAGYTLRTSSTTTNDRRFAQFLAAEYRVVIDQPYGELRLPIRREELPLSRVEVNGQSDYELVVQERDSLRFNPAMPGEYSLKLVFNPACELDENGRAQLQAQIPRVPSATINVIFDASTDVDLVTRGRQLKFENMITATLGPTDRIACSWRTASTSSTTVRPVRAASRLWINTRSDQLVAAGILQIENPAGLSNPFRIIIDENWEPIGSFWGDVELISSESNRIGNRRAYQVRFRRDVDISSTATAAVRLLMAPRLRGPTTTLPAPFLALERTGPSVDRTLTWSADDRPQWRLDGLSVWPEITTAASGDWQELQLATHSTSYRVPMGNEGLNIRRLPTPDRAVVSEVTRVHLSFPESRLVYSVKGKQPFAHESSLRLEIPKNSRIEYVRANDVPAEFEILVQATRELLVVSHPTDSEVYSIDLELSFPTWLSSPSRTRSERLARVLLLDANVESSVVRVLRTAGLQCDLSSALGTSASQESLALESVVARPFDLLVNLEAVVGQIDLKDGFRESAYLPLEFQLSRRQDVDAAQGVLYLERTEDNWIGKLEAEWGTSEEPLDFLFFEIPASIRESIDTGNLPRRFIPTGDPQRVTLCLIPPAPVQGKTRVELKFPLASAVSQQTLTIPYIQLLSLQQDQVESPIIALPRADHRQGLSWDAAGGTLPDDWIDPLHPEQQTAFSYMRPLVEEMQLAWERNKPGRERSEILYTNLQLQSVTAEHAVGQVEYWIQPDGQREVKLEVPQDAVVIAASVGDRLASTAQVSDGVLSVLLQPNYLPVVVRVNLRWNLDGSQPQINLPRLDSAGSLHTLQVDESQERTLSIEDSYVNQSARVAEIWAKILGDALVTATGFGLPEREAWLAGWHPNILGLSRNVQVSSLNRVLDSGNPTQQSPIVGIDVFWETTCERLQVDPARVDEKIKDSFGYQRSNNRDLAVRLLNQESIKLRQRDSSGASMSQLSAAGLVLLVVVLTMRFASDARLTYVQLMSAFPWVYWLQLGILTWILLPTYWPALVLMLTAIALAFGQYFDYRRTSHLR